MKNLLKKLHTPVWLFVLLLIVLIARVPSFFEPYSYGDEMIYLTLGEAVRQGIPLYKEIHDNKPPLLYLMAAIAGNLFWFKAILAIWHLVTIFVFWKLSKVLLPKKQKSQMAATVTFAIFTTIPLLEGNIINAELFMIGPTIAGFLILLSRKLTFRNIFYSGLLFSIATLFKIPAAFDVPAIVFYWLITQGKLNKKSITEISKRTLVLLSGFLAPIALTFVWYTVRGAFQEYFVAAFLQNIGYLSSWRPGDIQKSFLERNGPFLIRAGILALTFLLLFRFKKKLSSQFIFISIWLFLTLFAVTLSERPYPHYLIQSVAPISLLAAILLTYKTKEQVWAIIPLSLAAFVPFYFKFWVYPTFPYYSRFIRLATNQISRNEYLSTFGSAVLRNYQIASFVASSTKPDEKIFVWGDGVPIYALSRRLPPGKYVADYHIKDFSSNQETAATLKGKMPSFIITFPETPPFPELEFFIVKNYGLVETIDGAKIWKLFNPRVRSLFAP